MIDYSKFGFLPYQVRWLEYNVWFSSNNETNACEYVDYCKKFAKVLSLVSHVSGGDKLLDDAEANTFVITFANGYKITGLSSSPNQLHGKGGKIVLDDFAHRDNEFEVWEEASPTALVWGHPIRIISTHRGKLSVFYSFIKRIDRGELTWSKHRTTFPEAVREGLADKSLKKKCTKEEQDAYIAKIRDSVGDPSIWAQQFMCEPQDENETFLSYQLLESAGRAELLPFEELAGCRELYGGLDVGRIKNFTLLWLIEITLQQKLDKSIRQLPNPSNVLKSKSATMEIFHKVARQADIFPQISNYKSALGSIQPLISAKNKSLDTFFTEYLKTMGLRQNLIQTAVAARDYGFAVLEVTEYTEFEGKTVPAKLELCPPEYFTFDRERKLRLKNNIFKEVALQNYTDEPSK